MTNRLRVLRAERNLAQYQLAQLARIEATRFWRIEHGLVTPTEPEQRQIAGALGVTSRRIWPRRSKATVDVGTVHAMA